jgi:hypothetical protein
MLAGVEAGEDLAFELIESGVGLSQNGVRAIGEL